MAVTITVAELTAALRLNDTAEETAEVTRLLAYANALRSSGAARMLLPYRIHRAGYYGVS